MIWKLIGHSVIGSSHIQSGKDCEDAIHYEILKNDRDEEIVVGFISDGAGSAKFAKEASNFAVKEAASLVSKYLNDHTEIEDFHLIRIVEEIYDSFKIQARDKGVPINEFSCTLLGFINYPDKCCFLQIGDGAIIRNDGSGYFTHVWWPHNGEYQNTTTFLVDNVNVRNIRVKIIQESITEIAIFTDGLQMLALNYDSESVHQPFFSELFKWLRLAASAEEVSILNRKLSEYLSSFSINSRTDDDKTLLLATRYKV